MLSWEGSSEHGLTAIDRQTGQVVWDHRDQRIISNIAVANGSVFALDLNGMLWRFNLKTGNVIGFVQFQLLKGPDNLLWPPGSYLAAIDDKLAIYFQDTHMLSVFQLASTQ